MNRLLIPYFLLWLLLILQQSQLVSILRKCEALSNTSDLDLDFEGENDEEIERTNPVWMSSGIVPMVIDTAPRRILKIKYENTLLNKLGKKLTTVQTMNIPVKVTYQANPQKFYTLSMVDPDATIEHREVNHWLVVNIPGANIDKGETLVSYRSPAPPKDSGLHRYTFLLFKQPEKFQFEDLDQKDFPQFRFSIKTFARLYKLGKPLYGNFFQAQYSGS